MDYQEICEDEIALEGLDGITLPTLWLRLSSHRSKEDLEVTEFMKDYFWRFILQNNEFSFYTLPQDRNEPQIFERYTENTDYKSVFVAACPDELDEYREVYSTKPVADDASNSKGACLTFLTRGNVTEEIRTHDWSWKKCSEKYGQKRLVVVASQSLRVRALNHSNLNPELILNLDDITYCVLEHVARSRWQGELQAILNKQVFIDKSYHIHYVMAKLYKLGLVTKRAYSYRREDKKNKIYFQILLHATRFQGDGKSRLDTMMNIAQETLEKLPNCTMNLADLRQKLAMGQKNFKSLFQHMVKSGVATIKVQDPLKKVLNISNKVISLVTKNNLIDEECDDEDTVDQEPNGDEPSCSMVVEQPLVHQSFAYVLERGSKGVTQRELLNFLKGYGKLESRNLCRIFEKWGLIKTIMVDHGRQRSQRHIPLVFAQLNLNNRQFSEEKRKMKELLSESSLMPVEDTSPIAMPSDACKNIDDTILSIAEDVSVESGLFSPPPTSEPPPAVLLASQSHTIITTESCDSEIASTQENSFTDDDCKLTSPKVSILSNELQVNASYSESSAQKKNSDAVVTTRKMKRRNIILAALQDKKIVESFMTLQKIITQSEGKEGIKTKIDRKTVRRLVHKMHDDGFLRHTIIPIYCNEHNKNFHFIMSLDCDQQHLQSAIDQAKFKLLGEEEKIAARTSTPKSLKNPKQQNISDSSPLTEGIEEDLKIDELSREKQLPYGFQPKFNRLRIVHQFVWYLAYGHPHSVANVTDSDNSQLLNHQGSDSIDLDKVRIYLDEMTWKRFLPPTPVYTRNGLSWLQVGDIAVILPIFVLCQFHRFTYEVENLEEWLEHEQKRFALVRHLPASTRALLFHKRKYLYSFVSCLEQLAFMGLVTLRKVISDMNCFAKESLMFYVHKNATIHDTRTSGKSYLHIDDKPYAKINFTFNSYSDVDAYWPKLKDICLRTRLGYKNCRSFSDMSYNGHRGGYFLKQFVAKHLDHKDDPKEDGEVPGDRKGAGGLDSSMYAHLYRNWIMYPHLTTKSVYATVSDEENTQDGTDMNPSAKRLPKLTEKNLVLTPAKKKTPRLATVEHTKPPAEIEMNARKRYRGLSKDLGKKKRRRMLSSDRSENKTPPPDLTNQNESGPKKSGNDFSIVSVSNVGRNEKVKGGRGVKRKQIAIQPEPVIKKTKIITTPEEANITKIGKHKIKYVDKRDLLALSNRRGRVRVTFTSAEDALLLLCRVASTILLKKYKMKGRNMKSNLVPWSVVRDLMQANISESKDKTSYAVGRRTLFIMKNQDTQICHDICVVDACSDRTSIAEILNKHSPDLSGIDLKYISETYRELVNALRERFRVHPGMISESIPDSIECLKANYIINIITPSRRKRREIPDSICLEAIMKSTIENLIYVSLSIQDDEFSIYQSYKSFEVYPENLIVTVFNQMKASGIVSNKLEVLRKKNTSLPFAVPSYHLSHLHASTFKSLIPPEVIPEFQKSMKELEESRRVVMDIDVSLGHVLIMVYLQLKNCMNVEIDVPDNIVFPDVPGTSLFENQFLAQMKEAQTELTNRLTKENRHDKKGQQSMSKLFPISILNAASALIKESSNSKQKENCSSENPDRSRSEVEDEDDVDTAEISDGDSKLAAIIKLYQRHPSYTNWLLLNNTGKTDHSKGLNYSLNSENVVLTPCRVTMSPSREFCTKINPEFDSADDGMKFLESKKWKNVEVKKRLHDLTAVSSTAESHILENILKTLEEKTSSGMTQNEIICHLVERRNLLFSLNDIGQDVTSSVLKQLIENELIFSVGLQERRYVHRDHVKIWMTKGFRFSGVKSKFQAEISHELHLLKSSKNLDHKKPHAADHEPATINDIKVGDKQGHGSLQMENGNQSELDDNETVLTTIADSQKEDKNVSSVNSEPIVISDNENEENQGSSQSKHEAIVSSIAIEEPETPSPKKPCYDFDSMQNKEGAKSSFKNLYEEVDFLCRPWHTLGGDINYKNAKMMLCSVFLKIMVSPGISYQNLYSVYELVLQPISLTELLGVLCEVGCVVRSTFKKPELLRLFSSSAHCQTQTYYEPSEDGLVKIGRIFSVMDEKIRMQLNQAK